MATADELKKRNPLGDIEGSAALATAKLTAPRNAPQTLSPVQQKEQSQLNPALLPVAALAKVGAPAIDAGRNAIVRLAGGDPNTAEGGANKYATQAQGLYDAAKKPYGEAVDSVRKGVLSLTGASALATPPAASGTQPATPARPGAPAPAAQPAPPSWQSLGGGVNVRTNESGVREYSNAPGVKTEGNRDMRGGMTVVPSTYESDKNYVRGAFERSLASGDLEGAMRTADRNDPQSMARLGQLEASRQGGTAILIQNGDNQQTKALNSAVRQLADQAAEASLRGRPQAAARLAQAAASLGGTVNTAEQNERSAQSRPSGSGVPGPAGYAESVEQEGRMATQQANARASRQQQAIIDQLSDPNITGKQRNELQASLLALQGKSQKDTYVTVDEILGTDSLGNPIKGQVVIDPLTGQKFGGNPLAQAPSDGKQVGGIYTDANGKRARFGGYDEQGREIWE